MYLDTGIVFRTTIFGILGTAMEYLRKVHMA